MVEAEGIELDDWLQLGVTVLSLAVFAIALLAWRRRPTARTRLVTLALGVYALRGVLLVVDFVSEEAADVAEPVAIVGDLVFLGLILAAALQR